MPIKLIIVDIDGCISPESSEAWNLDAFNELARRWRDASAGRGGLPPLTLCTGRPQPYVEVLMKLFDIRLPAICENGAVIYTLADNRARYGPGVTPEKIAGLRQVRAFVEDTLLPSAPGVVLQFGKEAQMSIFSENPALLPPLRPRIEAFVREHRGPDLHITASHYYLNISLTGVTKGAAIAEVIRDLHLTRPDLAGVGDTEGDLPLREAVGFFACPSNATPGIKAVSDYVSPSPDIRGLLDILDRVRR